MTVLKYNPAAASSLGPAYDSPRPIRTQLTRWRTAARHRVSTFPDDFRAWLKRVFGEVEFKTGDFLCRACGDDVHNFGEACPRQIVGDCSTCGGTVPLDAYGNCQTNRPTHFVSNRRRRP